MKCSMGIISLSRCRAIHNSYTYIKLWNVSCRAMLLLLPGMGFVAATHMIVIVVAIWSAVIVCIVGGGSFVGLLGWLVSLTRIWVDFLMKNVYLKYLFSQSESRRGSGLTVPGRQVSPTWHWLKMCGGCVRRSSLWGIINHVSLYLNLDDINRKVLY